MSESVTSAGLINPLTQLPISDQEIKSVSELIRQQIELTADLQKKTEELQHLEGKVRRLQEILIPEAMAALGMESLKLSDGTKVDITTFYSARIPEGRSDEAFNWLRENNFGSLIKRDITCKFGKGEEKAAEELVMRLDALGYAFNDKTSVHPQTLKAFVKEQMEANANLPSDLFGVFVGKRTKLTPPTKK